jgi:hypothetical protein
MALGIAGFLALQGVIFDANDAMAKANQPAADAAKRATYKKMQARVTTKADQPTGSDLALTVGMTLNGDGSTCGTDTSLVANVGDTIDFCYTVTNNSSTAMAYSTLDDSVDGNIFTNEPTAIAGSGGTYVYHRSVVATADATHDATWTAQDLLPGYTADDTAAAAFVDISATGTALGLGDDDEAGITIPFQFSFYGVSSNQLCIGNNGAIVFGVSTCAVAFANTALPATGFGGSAIMPFWDDFFEGSGDVYWHAEGTSPNQRVIVQWDRPHYDAGDPTPSNANLEVILNENGSLSFQYQSTDFGNASFDDGVSATIGLQNADGSLVNQYSFNTVLSHPAPSAINWMSGTATILTATASTSLDVGAPVIGVTPTSISETAASGSSTPVTVDLSIANTGDRDLDWSITEAEGTDSGVKPSSVSRSGDRVNVATGEDRKSLYAARKLALSQGHPVQADYRNFGAIARPSSNVLPAGSECGETVEGIIIHDDGTAENGYSGNPATVSSFIGVDKFTPSSYPSTFTNVCVDFVTNAGATSVDFEVVVYDDTGADGGPGAELGAVSVTGGTVASDIGTLAFNNVDISALGLNVTAGSVYIGVRFSPQTESGVYVASDESGSNPPAGGYLSFDTGSGPEFTPAADSFPEYTSLFVRAIEGTAGCVSPADVPWLSVAPTSGTVEVGGAADTATVTLNPSGLVDGYYTANVCVASNDPAHATTAVPVEFAVGDVAPAATVDPTSLDFAVETGETGSDTLTVSNTGSPGSHLTFTVTEAETDCGTPSDVAWLSASPTSGDVTVGTPAAVEAAVDTASLAVGSYSAVLCLATNDPAQAMISIPVTLTVSPGDLIFADGFDGAGDPNVVTGDINEPVTGDGDGSSFDFALGDFHPYSGSITTDDINLYTLGLPAINVYWYGDAVPAEFADLVGGVVATPGGTDFRVLQSGDTIGPDSPVSAASSGADMSAFEAGVDGYIGVAFYNEGAGAVNYGYLHVTTSAGGFPVQVLDYGYNSVGEAVTIP